jgi:putative FmdB family regulatory protein
MPIYEYHCQSCGHTLEVLQKISDEPLINCPKCGKNSLEKIISATQFQLKGSGWYVTDFKKEATPKKADAPVEKNTTEKAPETPSGKTDAKE